MGKVLENKSGTRARGKMSVEGCRSIKITKKWNAGGGAKLPSVSFYGYRVKRDEK